jgi:hypothetical protein
LVKFCRVLQWKMCVYNFTTVGLFYSHFCIFNDHSVNFGVIRYIFPHLGML